MCDELTRINAIPVVLDDKKCATLKKTIEHIQSELRRIFNVKIDTGANAMGHVVGADSGDEVDLHFLEAEESVDESGEDVEMRDESNFISSLQEPSFKFYSQN